MTKEQQVRIQNFKEQYNSILRNISDANKELESALFRTEESKEFLKKIQKNTEEKGRELIVLLSTAKETEETIDNKRIVLDRRELELNEREEFIGKEESDALSEMIHEKRVLSYEIKEMNEKISWWVGEISAASKVIKRFNSEIDRLKKEEYRRERVMTSLGEEIINTTARKNILEKNYNKQKDALTYALKEAKEEVKKEKEKVDEPMNGLAQREKDVALRERDAQIIVNRLRNIYKEYLPHVTFKL